MSDRTTNGIFFGSLGLPKPQLALVKAELLQRVRRIVAERKLTNQQIADLIGNIEPWLLEFYCGHIEKYSIDQLFRFLVGLGHRLDVFVRPHGQDFAVTIATVTDSPVVSSGA